MFKEEYPQFISWYNTHQALEFGLDKIDENVRLRPGEVLVCGARPGEGKTTLACQFAFDWASQGKKIIFFSNESPRGEILTIMLTRQLRTVNSRDIRDNNISEGNKKSIEDCLAYMDTFDLTIYDQGEGMHQAKIFEILHEKKPDIFFLDHLQMVRKENEYVKTHEGIGEFLRILKEVIRKTGTTAVLLSQVNRQAESRRFFIPNPGDLKDSGNIEEYANVIFLLSWPYRQLLRQSIYKESSPDAHKFSENDFFIEVAKNRGGAIKVQECYYEPKYCNFLNKTKEITDFTSGQ